MIYQVLIIRNPLTNFCLITMASIIEIARTTDTDVYKCFKCKQPFTDKLHGGLYKRDDRMWCEKCVNPNNYISFKPVEKISKMFHRSSDENIHIPNSQLSTMENIPENAVKQVFSEADKIRISGKIMDSQLSTMENTIDNSRSSTTGNDIPQNTVKKKNIFNFAPKKSTAKLASKSFTSSRSPTNSMTSIDTQSIDIKPSDSLTESSSNHLKSNRKQLPLNKSRSETIQAIEMNANNNSDMKKSTSLQNTLTKREPALIRKKSQSVGEMTKDQKKYRKMIDNDTNKPIQQRKWFFQKKIAT